MASWPIKMWEMDLVVSPVRKFYLYQKDHPRAPNRGGEVGVGGRGRGQSVPVVASYRGSGKDFRIRLFSLVFICCSFGVP